MTDPKEDWIALDDSLAAHRSLTNSEWSLFMRRQGPRPWLRLFIRLAAPVFEISRISSALRASPHFVQSYLRYRRVSSEEIAFLDLYPCLGETNTPEPVAPYMYESLWAAQKITASKPAFHVDIGSQVFFVLMLAIHVKTIVVDVRTISHGLPNLNFVQGTLLNLPFKTDSIPSITCLSVAEHIGLARYDNAIDPAGTAHAAAEISRVLAPGGSLYFSLPLGRPRVAFNAHRIHSAQQVQDMFASLKLLEFALVNTQGQFQTNGAPDKLGDAECPSGMFLFTKQVRRAL